MSRSRLLYIVSLYLVLALASAMVMYRDYLVLLFLASIVFSLVYRKYYLLFMVFNASSLYLLSISEAYFYTLIPYIIMVPYILRKSVRHRIEPLGVVGCLSRRILSSTGLFMPVVIVKPTVSLFYLTLYSYLFLLIIVNYSRLRSIACKVMYKPKTVALAVESYVSLIVESSVEAVVFVVDGRGVVLSRRVGGAARVDIPLKFTRVGTQRFTYRIYAVDPSGYTTRLVDVVEGYVNVIPFTYPIARKIRRILEEIKDFASVPVEIRVYTRHGMVGFEPGIEETVSTEQGFLTKLLYRVLSRVREYTYGVKRSSRTGDYSGAREFTGGDNPRDIHWKKSISLQKLYVKEYSGGVPGGEGTRLVVIVDLYAPNNTELDRVTYETISILLGIASRDPAATIVLVIVSPMDDEVLVIRGNVYGVLHRFTKIYEGLVLRLFYEHDSIPVSYSDKAIQVLKTYSGESMLLGTMSSYSMYLARKLLDIVSRRERLFNTLFTIVCSDSVSLHYSIVKDLFTHNGYHYIVFKPIPYKEVSRVITSIVSR